MTSNTNINDRFISLNPPAILQVVTFVDGHPALINLDEAPENDVEFDAIGIVMTDDMIKANGFRKIIEVSPKVTDHVAARVADGKFIVGTVVDESTNLVVIETGPRVQDRITMNKKRVYSLGISPRDEQVLKDGQTVQVINPFNERYTLVGTIYSTFSDAEGNILSPDMVLVEFFDGTKVKMHSYAVAPYTLNDTVAVLGTSALPHEQLAAAFTDVFSGPDNTFAGRPVESYFGADFIPANVVLEVDRDDSANVLGEIFSVPEFALLVATKMTDDDDLANMIGIVVNEGRNIPDGALRAILDLTIPYGFSSYIDDARDFFARVGQVANEQAERNIEALTRGEKPQDFAAPTEVVFSRIVGYDPEALHAVVEAEPADGSAAGPSYTPPPAPEEASDDMKAVLSTLDKQFGAGNYRLLTAEEAVEVFGPSAIEAIQNGDVFGQVINPATDVSSLYGVPTTDEAEAFNEFINAVMGGIEVKAPTAPLPPQRNTVADAIKSLQEVDPNVDIDECLMEFDTLAKAGQTDSTILARQIDEAMDRSRTIETMLVEDLNKAVDAISGIQAGLKLLVENRIETGRLSGNARMIADAFEAVGADVNNLQRLREDI